MISENAAPIFNLDTFLNGPVVISDSTRACEFVLKQIRELRVEPFWQIILNNPKEDCSSLLDRCIKKDPKILKTTICAKTDRKFFVTPLIGSIFSGNYFHIKFLLEKTKNINKPDAEGYTPCHYAAMVANVEVLKLLKSMGADFERQTLAGSTPIDFIKHRFYHLPGVNDFSIYIDYTGPAYNQHFYQTKVKFKSTYLTHLVYLPETLLSMRVFGKGGLEESDTSRELGTNLYEQFLTTIDTVKEIPPIYMQPLVAKDNGAPIPEFLKGQYEVKARRDIKPGELLIEYTGYCISDHFAIEKSPKRMTVKGATWERMYVDGEKGGNIASFINDGPPNCMSIRIMHQGLPHQVIVSICEIKKDEAIRLCYGKNFFEAEDHVELAPRAIENYLHETEGLTKIASILYRYENNLVVDMQVDEKESTCNARYVKSEDRIEHQIRFRYHIGMIRYLISYESHLKEYIENRLINPFVLKNILHALFEMHEIQRLGLDENSYGSLYNKIATWAKFQNSSNNHVKKF